MGENTFVEVSYLVAIVMFIVGIKRLGRVRTARAGNRIAGLAMGLVIVATVYHMANRADASSVEWGWIIGGAVVGSAVGLVAARRVAMTEMPEMVALLNGLGGAASALVALSIVGRLVAYTWGSETHFRDQLGGGLPTVAFILSIVIGGVTLTGSLVAWGKLSGKVDGRAITFSGQHSLNAALLLVVVVLGAVLGWVVGEGGTPWMALLLTLVSLGLGVLLVIPIGGADMPVVISLLNSYSGIAAAMTGFVLRENVLIVSGAMVGASGIILTNIMCRAMNRSLTSVLLGGFGQTAGETSKDDGEYKNVKSVGAEELAMMLDGVGSVIMVPGYGLAVSQAQHAVRELAEFLESRGVEVRYAIHPVAGRMPGHMNVLLAEANISYEKLVEMDEINPEFKTTDVAIVLGANDVVNPAAINDPKSPLAGMPILNVHEARNVVIIKRSLSPGYAGVKNPLFEADNAAMLYADARVALQETLKELKAA